MYDLMELQETLNIKSDLDKKIGELFPRQPSSSTSFIRSESIGR